MTESTGPAGEYALQVASNATYECMQAVAGIKEKRLNPAQNRTNGRKSIIWITFNAFYRPGFVANKRAL
jgi:hypothetical protein